MWKVWEGQSLLWPVVKVEAVSDHCREEFAGQQSAIPSLSHRPSPSFLCSHPLLGPRASPELGLPIIRSGLRSPSLQLSYSMWYITWLVLLGLQISIVFTKTYLYVFRKCQHSTILLILSAPFKHHYAAVSSWALCKWSFFYLHIFTGTLLGAENVSERKKQAGFLGV